MRNCGHQKGWLSARWRRGPAFFMVGVPPYPIFPVVSSMAMAEAIPLAPATEEAGGAETAGWGTRGRSGVL